MSSFEKPCILIVDDVPANVNLLSAILEPVDCRIATAYSGTQAVTRNKEEKPSIVLLDIMMPGMDGFEVCTKLKKDSGSSVDPGIIFISAKNSAEDKVKAFSMGAIDYISKPFFPEEILARVKIHLMLRETHDRLKESEEKYSLLIKNLQDGIFLWTPADGIIFCNPAFSNMTGFSEMELTGKQLHEIFYGTDAELAAEYFYNTFRDEILSCEMEFNLRISTEDGKTVHTGCLPGYVVIQKTPAVLVTVRDLTERVNLEKQLLHRQKMEALGGLTAGIAHDFNNILSLINGYSELAMHDVPPDSPVSEKLKIIHNAGKNAVSLTKGLLSFGRKKNFLLEPVDIKSELQNLNNFIRKGLPENINLEISSDFEPGKYVRGDSGMLQQVFINLCLNARDAMPDGGTIKVCPAFVEISEIPPSAPPDTGKGEYISVMFKDNGAGIPEKLIPKIFDPFFSTKEKRGTGLGLAMVEKIIRNHHGWIDVTSAPGQGSTFTIFLPVIKKHNPPREAREPFQHNRKESRNAVIVVDDDEIQLSMLKFYLKKAKYDVTTALSSEEAIKIIEKAPDKFHTAIIDHVMPGMTGSQSCTLIRERWPHIKTILVSGAGNVPLTGDFFLRKPFTARDLLLIFEAIK